MELLKKRKESGTRMTASVLNQDPNWEKEKEKIEVKMTANYEDKTQQACLFLP